MNAIDQHKITASWEQSLVPAPALIDGRTEQDWLTFLSRYASLINFYDGNNQLKGNWSPFLIKDPVFLLASITKTRFTEIHSRYVHTCAAIERLLQPDAVDAQQVDISRAFNILFNELTDIFIQIKQWIYFMQMTNDDYDLKTYTIHQTKTTFSGYYWALTALQQNLYITSVIPGINPVDYNKFYFFDAYEEVIWKANKGSNPYWKVLGLKNPLKENSSADIYQAIKDTGDKVFVFFNTLVKNAGAEFEKLRVQKSRYPDTTLLRAFVHLLKLYQQQLNGISQKHLNFYYKDILKQQERPAVPDSVYLCSSLAKPRSTFNLPAGTVFSAGLDAQKNPILFSTTANVELNPATITGGYTLSRPPGTSVAAPFSLKSIPAAGVVQKDKAGKTQSWQTFGGNAFGPPQTLIKPCIAFASPLLFLQEGARDITLSITFSNTGPTPLTIPAVRYFLSTLSGWLDVTGRITNSTYTGPGQGLGAVISLQVTDPPIQAFQKINPDGLKSQWPLLKLEFAGFTDTANPPVISDLSITVTVNGAKTFQLFNDYGALSTKTAFQLFGPTPMVSSHFIIGSNEIFSKPFNSLVIQLNWDQLPKDFAAYYERYNTYIEEKYPPLPSPPSPSPQSVPVQPTSSSGSIPTPLTSPPESDSTSPSLLPAVQTGTRFTRFIKGLFSKAYTSTEADTSNDADAGTETNADANTTDPGPFNDECFTVDFGLLQNANWKQLPMNWYIEDPASPVGYGPNPPGGPDPLQTGQDIGLFVPVFQQASDGTWVDVSLTPSSVFGYPQTSTPTTQAPPAENGDPSIQNTVLKFTDASTSGFMRMTLTGPETYGFGSGIYADVVSCIALTNAMVILDKPHPKNPPFSPAARLPFVPKLTGFTGNYSATCTYQFTSATDPETYPIQCFLYTPFNNYLAYDNSEPAGDSPKSVKYNYAVGASGTASTATAGIPLFDPYNYDGYLLLEMSGLLPASSFNIYFELARNYKSSSAAGQIGYYYISKTGWKKLPLLADGTNKFSCSGIITVAVPDDIANDTPVMPGSSYWFCIAVQDPATSFSQTVFFGANGIMASRSSSISSSGIAPKLAANTISKPQPAVPQIATTVQPFASFGGEAAETYTDMNLRISSRILTKDRAVFAGDYPMLIRQEFSDIYFAKAVFDAKTGSTGVYVVNGYADWSAPNAFLPLVTECAENKISSYLAGRCSAFTNITVSNFNIQYVKVFASVIIATGLEPLDMQQKMNQALNIFLSPWISSSASQVIIGQGITGAMVASLLKSIAGVVLVNDVRFQSWRVNEQKPSKWSLIGKLTGEPAVAPISATELLVSCMDHQIQFTT